MNNSLLSASKYIYVEGVFNWLSLKGLIHLYTSLAKGKGYENVRQYIIWQMLFMLERNPINLQEHEQIFTYRYLNFQNDERYYANKLKTVTQHIRQIMEKTSTSYHYKVVALSFLARLNGKGSDIAEDVVDRWFDEQLQDPRENELDFTWRDLLTPAQAKRCYERVINPANQDAPCNSVRLSKKLTALKLILPRVCFNEEELFNFLVQSQKSANLGEKKILIEMLTVCLPYFSVGTELGVKACRLLMRLLPASTIDVDALWDENHLISKDHEHSVLTYFISRLSRSIKSSHPLQLPDIPVEEMQRLQLIVSYMPRDSIDTAWSYVVGQLDSSCKSLSYDGSALSRLNKVYSLLVLLSVLVPQMDEASVEVLICHYLNYFISTIGESEDSEVKEHVILFYGVLGKHLSCHTDLIKQGFAALLPVLRESSAGRGPFDFLDLLSAAAAMLSYVDMDQDQIGLYTLVAQYSHYTRKALCHYCQDIIPFLTPPQRLLVLVDIVAELKRNLFGVNNEMFLSILRTYLSILRKCVSYVDAESIEQSGLVVVCLMVKNKHYVEYHHVKRIIDSFLVEIIPFITTQDAFLLEQDSWFDVVYGESISAFPSLFQFHGSIIKPDQRSWIVEYAYCCRVYEKRLQNFLCLLVITGNDLRSYSVKANTPHGKRAFCRTLLDHVINEYDALQNENKDHDSSGVIESKLKQEAHAEAEACEEIMTQENQKSEERVVVSQKSSGSFFSMGKNKLSEIGFALRL